MSDPSKFDADPEVVQERTPAACPFCGYSGAFDGQGPTVRRVEVLNNGDPQEYGLRYERFRCAECNGHFEMLGQSEQL